MLSRASVLLALLLALAGPLGVPLPARACTADVGAVTPDNLRHVFDHVVVARVIGMRRDPSTGYWRQLTIRVEEVIRGGSTGGRMQLEIDGCHPIVLEPGHRVAIASMRLDELSAYHTFAWDLDETPGRSFVSLPYYRRYPFEPKMTAVEILRFLRAGLPDTSTESVGAGSARDGWLAFLAIGGLVGMWALRRRRTAS